MKLCFSTLGCTEKSFEDILSLAKGYGIPAIEVRGVDGVLDNTAIKAFCPAESENTARLLKQNNIVPIVLGTSCSFHNPEKFDKAIDEGVACIKIAESLGFRYIRVFGDRLTADKQECIHRITSGISHLCGISQNVGVLLEVHGDFNTVESLLPIIDNMRGIENFGLIWDIEHTHKTYGDSFSEFYDFARPLIRHVHIKDYSDTENKLTLIGDGDVPIKKIVNRLLTDGYDGYLSLEWEKKWHPELPDITVALDSFIKNLREVESQWKPIKLF